MRTTVATNENNSPGKLSLKSPFLLTRIRRIYQITFASLLLASVLASYYFRLNLVISAISVLGAITLSLIIYQSLKGVVTGSVHGDYLIVTHRLTNKSKVVDVRHLKRIKSVRFLGFCGTKFTYNLDGVNRRVILLCSGGEQQSVAKYLRELKKAA